MSIYTDHWLYHYIPHNRNELFEKSGWQQVMWAVFGNDDDGIFGEGPKSGTKWTESWSGKTIKEQNFHNPGTINFQRFVLWQLRNPLHNFTHYVVGFKEKKNVVYTQILLISTAEISFYKEISRPNVFPMRDHTGIYFGLHNRRPFLSWRVNLIGIRWLEGYSGWRPGGGLGLAFRLKKTIKHQKVF